MMWLVGGVLIFVALVFYSLLIASGRADDRARIIFNYDNKGEW